MSPPAILLTLALLAAGCASAPPEQPAATDPAPASTPASTNACRRAAVVLGLSAVDPAAYGGWAGACPGSETDAEVWAILCRQEGVEPVLLLNAAASIRAVETAILEAARPLGAGDLLVLYYSGHGGQVADLNGDEDDRRDETLCLWDGSWTDDRIGALLARLPAGLRVFFVTDSCHSGTNYRSRSRARAVPRGFQGSLIHFGGCADPEVSYGSDQGGVFTTALIDVWTSGSTYKSWFMAAAARMPFNQRPTYEEFGTVDEAFRGARVLR